MLLMSSPNQKVKLLFLIFSSDRMLNFFKMSKHFLIASVVGGKKIFQSSANEMFESGFGFSLVSLKGIDGGILIS